MSDLQNSMSNRKLHERADVGHERRGLITQKGRCWRLQLRYEY